MLLPRFAETPAEIAPAAYPAYLDRTDRVEVLGTVAGFTYPKSLFRVVGLMYSPVLSRIESDMTSKSAGESSVLPNAFATCSFNDSMFRASAVSICRQ